MKHVYTKLFLSFAISTAVVANMYEVPTVADFADETQLLAASIQPGLTLPQTPQPIMPPAVALPAAPTTPQNISPTPEVHPTSFVTPPGDLTTTPTFPTPIEPIATAPVTTVPTHVDTPIFAQPLEQKDKVVPMEPKVEIQQPSVPLVKESDERIKLLTEQLAQVEQKLTALESRLQTTEQKAHKTDSQLTALINELEAPAPQEDEEPIVGSAPGMEPKQENKSTDIPLFEDDDEEESDETNQKL